MELRVALSLCTRWWQNGWRLQAVGALRDARVSAAESALSGGLFDIKRAIAHLGHNVDRCSLERKIIQLQSEDLTRALEQAEAQHNYVPF